MARVVDKPKIRKDFEHLRSDASKMIEDLGELSRHIADSGRETRDRVSTAIAERFAHDVEGMKSRLDVLSDQTRAFARTMNSRIAARPLPYIAGAVGVGMLIAFAYMARGAFADKETD